MNSKIKLRHFFFFVALVILGLLVVANLGRFNEFVELLGRLNLLVLIFIIPIRYLSYWANARYFTSFFKIYGIKTKEKKLFVSVVTMNFVNTVFPTGGISGLSYITRALKDEVDTHTTTIAQIFWQAFTVLGYFGFLVFAFLSLFVTSAASRIAPKAVLLLILLMIGLGLAALIIAFSRTMTEGVLYWATRPLNTVLRVFRKNLLSRDRVELFLDDFYQTLEVMKKNKHKVWPPLLWTIAGLVCEVMSVYIVFVAFGSFPNPGVVITGYCLALLASSVSLFSGGVGIYEATMIASFVALGTRLGLSISVVAVYRMIAFWLFLPVGLYFYKRATLDDDDQSLSPGVKHGK